VINYEVLGGGLSVILGKIPVMEDSKPTHLQLMHNQDSLIRILHFENELLRPAHTNSGSPNGYVRTSITYYPQALEVPVLAGLIINSPSRSIGTVRSWFRRSTPTSSSRIVIVILHMRSTYGALV